MNAKASVVPCGGKYVVYEEKKELYKTDDATVEVTIKLRKKQKGKPRSQKSQLNQAYNAEPTAHRAGSWGDLLLRKKVAGESQASVGNAGDQGLPLPVAARPKTARPRYHQGKPPRSEVSTAGKLVHAQVGFCYSGEDDNMEPKTIYHRKKSKYGKTPLLYRSPPDERDELDHKRTLAPNAPCTHHEKYIHKANANGNGPGSVQFQVPQPSVKTKIECVGLGSKCCDACTCYTVNSQLKDQESQTSMLAHQPTAAPSGVSLATTTTQTTMPSPPTKETTGFRRQLPPQKYSPPQQQHFQSRSGLSSGYVKPKHTNSSPEKHTYKRISSTRRSETAISTTVSTTTRRKEDVQLQLTDREREGQRSNSATAAGTGAPLTTRAADQVDHEAILQNMKKLSDLEVENLKLRKDTAALVEQVDKAKTERQEYISTIKELYELAEVLRHENVILIGNHEDHRTLQDKLMEAVGENQVLKQHLQELTAKIPPPPSAPAASSHAELNQSKDNQNQSQSHIKDFWRVRDILKEVKTVIADEINGLQNVSLRKSPPKIDDSDILELFEKMGPTSGINLSRNLNDTNGQCDDEIQHILNISAADRSDVRSSTQYLDLQGSDGKQPVRHFVPSPGSDISSL